MVSVVGEEGVAGVGDEGTTGVEVDGVGKEGEVGVSDVPEKLSEEGVSVRGKAGVTKETTEVVGLCSVEEEGRIVGGSVPAGYETPSAENRNADAKKGPEFIVHHFTPPR